MPIHIKNNLSYYTFSALDDHRVIHGVFMRRGGVSSKPWSSLNMATSVGDSRESVIENRKRITRCLSLADDSIFDVWQIHSNTVVQGLRPRKLDQAHQKADAIITDKSNVTLMMLFADCVPIMLFDPVRNVAALAHAGWQGTVSNIVGETLRSMQEKYLCKTNDVVACIGPSICARHYDIGNDVAAIVNRSFRNTDQILVKINGNIHLDLQMANKHILQKYGVMKIQDAQICTACNVNDWYSHRKENGITGRFAAVITVKPVKNNDN